MPTTAMPWGAGSWRTAKRATRASCSRLAAFCSSARPAVMATPTTTTTAIARRIARLIAPPRGPRAWTSSLLWRAALHSDRQQPAYDLAAGALHGRRRARRLGLGKRPHADLLLAALDRDRGDLGEPVLRAAEVLTGGVREQHG